MMEYDPDNIFAKIIRGEIPCHKIYEDENTFAFMDINPRVNGHCLVLPKTPTRNLLDADDASLAAVIKTSAKLGKAVKKAFDADGVTLEQFNESAAGQSVYHLHVHVLPRIEGISMKPHMGETEQNDVLADNAAKIKAALD